MTMASVGSAVQAACRKARQDALARAGTSDLAAAMRRAGQPIEATADVTPGDAGRRFSMRACGAAFVEVAVDPDLGETRVRRVVGAYGAGRIVNPRLARSQCLGGMIGGIGMALMEHSVVDPDLRGGARPSRQPPRREGCRRDSRPCGRSRAVAAFARAEPPREWRSERWCRRGRGPAARRSTGA
jgi:hypothetical protein